MARRSSQPRWVAQVESRHGRILLDGVEVRDSDRARQRRRSIASHAFVAAIGVLLMQTLGIGWVLVPLAAIVHLALFGPKRLLLATENGLVVIEVRARSVETVAQMPVGANAALTLRANQPQVQMAILAQVDLTQLEQIDQSDIDQAQIDQPETDQPETDQPQIEPAPTAQPDEGTQPDGGMQSDSGAQLDGGTQPDGQTQAGALLWEGTVSGSDLKLAEAIVRASGGEPVRLKR